MTLLLAALLLTACERPELTPRDEFCAVYSRLGCREVWGEPCRTAYDRIALERSRGRYFCPREAYRAGNCDELAAVTFCGFDP